MAKQIEITNFSFDFADGNLKMHINGQPFDLRLLQKVEIVFDAAIMAPFVRLTVLAGATSAKFGNALLEVQQGEPGKPVFEPGCHAGHPP